MRRPAGALVVTAVALALSLVILLVSTAPPAVNDNPSSRVVGKAGTLAFYNWLGALGFDTHRVSDTFQVDGSDVLVMVDPTAEVSAPDAATIVKFIGGGGELILAVSPGSVAQASPLLTALHVGLDVERDAGSSVPAQPFDVGDRVHTVPMALGFGVDAAPFLAPLLVQGTTVTAAVESLGSGGRAYVVASPFPFSNDGLRDGDSALFALSLLEHARGGRIASDEYHHGEQSTATVGATAIFESPLGLALGLAVAAVLVYLAVSGRRLGRPLASADPSRVPSTGTYVAAMAGLYARSSDRGLVAVRYAEELKRRLGRSSGVDPTQADDNFVVAAGVLRPDCADELRAVLSRARDLAAGRPDAASLLDLARRVDDLERAWSEPAVARAQ